MNDISNGNLKYIFFKELSGLSNFGWCFYEGSLISRYNKFPMAHFVKENEEQFSSSYIGLLILGEIEGAYCYVSIK